MQVKAVLVERTSKKGNKYTCIEVYVTNNIKKLLFLSDAELELLRLSSK